MVNCQYLKRHLIEDERIPERIIRVCYNGIDLEYFHPAQFERSLERRAERPAPLPTDAFTIRVVCVLRPEKAIGTLIDAFARVRTLRPRMQLAIVGSGPQLEPLQQRAKAAGVFEDCIWQSSTPDVAPWYRNFDVFVLPPRARRCRTRLWKRWPAAAP